MKAFDEHVDRILRPLRASGTRKAKMREELLGHLATAYREEREGADSDETAVQAALARFGDADRMRDELQASVPALERVLYIRMGCRRPGESDAAYAFRMARWGTAFTLTLAACTAAGCVLSKAMRGQSLAAAFASTHWTTILATIGVGIPIVGALLFPMFFLELRTQKALRRGDFRSAVKSGLVSSAAFAVFAAGTALAVAWCVPSLFREILIAIGMAATWGLFGPWCTIAAGRWHLKHRPWIPLGQDF
ncbi:MAG: hypothetical protein JXR94_22845 [Candidatus Hydrogenedentes bacterium]|nr:hypothetical protein [Candidatus Hydrogenedentota bacterium]